MSEARRSGDSWVFEVTDVGGDKRTFAFAVRDGEVIFSGPRWCRVDIATVVSLASHLIQEIDQAGRS